MDRQPWLDRMREELAGKGLPAAVRARLLAELRDHLEDLKEEGVDMATMASLNLRMGTAGEVAAGAASEFRRGNWVARHPWLVFVAAPLPAVVVGLAAYLLLAWGAMAGTAAALGVDPDSTPRPALANYLDPLVHLIAFVPVAFAAAFVGWCALRGQVRWWWVAAAGLQLALLGGAVITSATYSDVPGQSQLSLGLWLGFPPSFRQVLQVASPLLVIGLFAWAGRRRAARAALAA